MALSSIWKSRTTSLMQLSFHNYFEWKRFWYTLSSFWLSTMYGKPLLISSRFAILNTPIFVEKYCKTVFILIIYLQANDGFELKPKNVANLNWFDFFCVKRLYFFHCQIMKTIIFAVLCTASNSCMILVTRIMVIKIEIHYFWVSALLSKQYFKLQK